MSQSLPLCPTCGWDLIELRYDRGFNDTAVILWTCTNCNKKEDIDAIMPQVITATREAIYRSTRQLGYPYPKGCF